MAYTATALDFKNIIISNDDCDPPLTDRPDLTTDFTTTPSEGPVRLPGKWKVNLSELYISGMLYNVPTPMKIDITLQLYDDGKTTSIKVSKELEPGTYSTFQELFDKIYEAFDHSFLENKLSLSDMLSLDFMSQKNTVVMKKLTSTMTDIRFDSLLIHIENELRYMLGMGENTEILLDNNHVFLLPYKADLYRGVNKFFVMVNMIENQIIGNSQGKVLRMIPIDYEKLQSSKSIHYSGDAWWCDVVTNSEYQLPSIRVKLVEDVSSEAYIRLEEGSSVSSVLQFMK